MLFSRLLANIDYMKKAEILLGLLVLISLILNITLTLKSTALTVLSLGILSSFYAYLSFALFNEIELRKIFKKESYVKINTLRIIGAILTGLALSTTIVGLLFIVQSWPGSSVNLGLGLFGLSISLIISILKYKKTKSSYYLNILKRIAIYGGLGLILFILPEGSWLDFKYQNYPDYIEAINRTKSDPNNQELWDKVDKEREKIK